MAKKAKVKGKVEKQNMAPKETVRPPQKTDTEENENAHDFGGIPNRDLKKNLGCG